MNSDLMPSDKPYVVWLDIHSATDSLCVTGRLETTRELRRLGWQVTLVLEGLAGQRQVRGVEVLCIPKPRHYLLGYCLFHLRFLRLLAREWVTVDAVLFPPVSAPWLLSLRCVRRLKHRRPLLVMDTRDLEPPGGNWKNRLRMLFTRFSCRLANRWADGQTAITQGMANLIHIPPGQLWGTWPSGVNLAQFAPARTARRWPVAGEPTHLIYVGSLHHVRNLLPLCQAVEKANAEGMKFILSLVGDGAARADLEMFALETGGRIRVIPPIPHDQIPGILAQAHVGVTSLFFPDRELFQASSPIKLFEYMAAGLPILATRMACHTDVVGNGEYAFWVEQPDVPGLCTALRLAWDAQTSLSKMGDQAATAASAWTWCESAKKLKAALEFGLEKNR